MKYSRVFASVTFFASSLFNLSSQSTGGMVGLPQTMRLCTDHCETLMWARDHFEGKSDSDGVAISTYTVEKWTADGVIFTGKPINLPPGMSVVAVFRGKIAPQGGGIVGPSLDLQINSAKVITGAPYQLSWTRPNVPSAPVSVHMSESQPPTPTPAQLQEPTRARENGASMLSGDDSNITAEEAEMKAITGIRSKDFAAALHWYEVSQSKGNVRAGVAIGVLYFDGSFGTPDYTEALKRFEEGAAKGDSLAMLGVAKFYRRPGVTADPQKVDLYWKKYNDRLKQFYPKCASEPAKATMLDLLAQSRSDSSSVLSAVLTLLLSSAMNISTNANPSFTITAVSATDVRANGTFDCDAMISLDSKQDLVSPESEADSQVLIASILANSAMKSTHAVQAFKISHTGPGDWYTVYLDHLGNSHSPFNGALPRTYSEKALLK